MSKHTIKRFGNGLHIIISKDEYREGEVVFITKNIDLENSLTLKQIEQVKKIVQNELWESRQGF